jgi:hypothetical protein
MNSTLAIKHGAVRTTAVGLALLAALAASLMIPGFIQGAGSTAPATGQKSFTAVYDLSKIGKKGAYEDWIGTGSGTIVGSSFCEAFARDIGYLKKVEGHATITAANGDSLLIDFTETYVGELTFSGPYTVVGGTGRFADASGTGTNIAILTPNPDGTTTVTLSFDGWISF